MLLYSPPFLMVGPVTVFPDHVDLESFYYVVSVPQLVVENGDPSFWATAILPPVTVDTPGTAVAGQAVGRALVSFDVNLPLPPDLDETLTKEIEKRWGRTPKRLVPAPLQAGTVTLTVARPNADQPSKELFVYSGHSPTLVGDNRAALAIAAQGDEAQALVAAMSVGHLAGVVTYELEMPGLAPSFQASMKVHWKKIYERFRQHDMTNFVFATEEVDRTIEHLEDTKDIDIDVKDLDPDGKQSATRALFDELKSQVIKNLFESPSPIGDTPIEERIGRGVREVLTSLLPGVSHTLRTLDQSTLQDTEINLREQKVNIYKLYPQTTLAGMLERGGHAASRLNFVRVEDLPNRIEQVSVEIAGGAAPTRRARRRGTRPGPLARARRTAADSRCISTSSSPERKTVPYRRLGVEEPSLRCKVEMLMDPAFAPAARSDGRSTGGRFEGNRISVRSRGVARRRGGARRDRRSGDLRRRARQHGHRGEPGRRRRAAGKANLQFTKDAPVAVVLGRRARRRPRGVQGEGDFPPHRRSRFHARRARHRHPRCTAS